MAFLSPISVTSTEGGGGGGREGLRRGRRGVGEASTDVTQEILWTMLVVMLLTMMMFLTASMMLLEMLCLL